MRSNSLYVLGMAWYNLFEANAASLGLEAVHYGDQARLETTPILCVEPEVQNNELYGASRTITSQVDISLYVYHSVVQSGQANRKDSDQFAQTISDFVHLYPQLVIAPGADALVTHCYITKIASGQAVKQNNTLVAASKLTISHTIGQIILPQSS